MKKIFTAKRWKNLKPCMLQGIIAFLICGVSFAHSNSTKLLDREVSISVSEVSFDEALTKLAMAANVKFAYSPEQLGVSEKVSIRADKRTLREVLNELLLPRRIKYVVHSDDTTISLKRSEENKEQSKDASGTDNTNAFLQVTGIVHDNNKQPIAGVNIVVKGTTTGTTSDADGKYAIQAEENDVLAFSFIGFAPQEINVNNQSVINVTLQEDAQNLSEVIINAGYWEVKQKEQTGSTSRVTAEQIRKQPINNPLQALQGRMTGVYIQQNTGMPGGGFTIQVRGQNSLRNGNNGSVNGNLPLYLVDGIPFTGTSLTSGAISSGNLRGGNPLSSINPNDIENIEVLKDADATAIYGSRGANGVILITTKKAKQGKTSLDLEVNSGIGKVTRPMPLLNTRQYLQMRKEAISNDGYSSLIGDPELDPYWPDVSLWDSTRYTNWQKKLIGGTAHITNSQMTFSGGNQQTQFLIGGSYYKETTVFPGNNSFQRASGRMTLNHASANKRFTIFGSVNYSSSNSTIPGTDFTSMAVTLAPNAPALYDNKGMLNWANDTWTNPFSLLKRKYNNTISNLVTNVATTYEIVKGLKAKTSMGYTSMAVNELRKNPLSSYDPNDLQGRTGSSSFADGNIKTWMIEPQLDYLKSFLGGDFSFLVGGTLQESIQMGKTIEATGYSNDALLENIDAATKTNIEEAIYSQYRYAALFSRVNYNWKEKYIVNITGRRDGSSRFGTGKQYANFGAIGGAWIFSNERWIANALSFLSFGKIRSSFGITGSDAIGNYQFLDTYTPTTYPYNNSSGLVVSRLSNPDYSWETNKKFEAGIELGFLQDRLSLTSAFYLNRSSNQLVGLPIPVMTGQSTVQYNLPAIVENRGWEVQLTTTNIKNTLFEWTTSLNATLPQNRLIEFPNLNKFPAYTNKYEVGKSVYIYKALVSTGVNPKTGVYDFQDRNGDGSIGSQDIAAINKITQAAYGGINNAIKFKGIQLDVFFQFVKQTGYSYERSFSFPGDFSNQPTVVMKRWTQEGDHASIQKFTALDPDGSVSTAYSNSLFSDKAVVDASFIRLKNVSLSWDLPEKWLRKSAFTYARLYVQGQNLLTITNYIGLDPENQTSIALPPLTMLTAGIQVKF